MSNVNETMEKIMNVDGAVGVALVDYESGMTLGNSGGGNINLDIAAAGNTEVMRSKMNVMKNLDLDDKIEDILITLGKQYHLIRPMGTARNLFLYAVFNRDKANLAMARHKVAAAEKELEV